MILEDPPEINSSLFGAMNLTRLGLNRATGVMNLKLNFKVEFIGLE